MPLPTSPSGCPMDALLRLLMGPWTTYILWILRQNGPTRFGALKRQIPGISSKVLTERLRMLEFAGVIYRDHNPTIPPKVTYGLAERGEELGAVLSGLENIARRWQADEDGAATRAGAVDRTSVAKNVALARNVEAPRLARERGPNSQ